MPTMKFAQFEETVITRQEFSLAQAKLCLKKEKIAVIGYGVQGCAQALNLKDNGFEVIIGQRESSVSWEKALKEGWIKGENLFSIEKACAQATIICYLLSDAGQIENWSLIKPYLTPGKTLCFSHGFALTYADQTGIIPPKEIDVILVAPKGSGRSVRQLFLQGKGINSSYACAQNASGKAKSKALALGIGIGSGYLFETNFKHEVYSDLVGERGVLMGAIAGIIAAQYETLRKHGHSPSEAFNETVEELTQSLVPLIGEKGMDWMFRNCSSTAQRGALDWMPRFAKITKPLFEELYASVASGEEAAIVIRANRQKDYRAQLDKELEQLQQQEIWQVGKQLRKLRAKKEAIENE